MNRKWHFGIVAALVLAGLAWLAGHRPMTPASAQMTSIVDQTGEVWDLSQAVTLGFKPQKFQYGIGRYAFQTLSDVDLAAPGAKSAAHQRVIGIADGQKAHAYSVRKLARHEVANTHLENKPIAAAY